MTAEPELTFHVSDVRVEVRCALPEVLRGLAAVWRSCEPALLPERRRARFTVHADGGTFVIEAEGGRRETGRREDVLPLLEGLIYAAMPVWHQDGVLLHAACLRAGATPLLLLGPSGGGKSSLALAALRAGWQYQGDELAVTDGRRVWGVPRALQFTACTGPAGLPPWAGDADVESYRLRLEGEQLGCVPLVSPSRAQVADAPFPAEALRIVAVGRAGTSAVEPLASLEALGLLHEACFVAPHIDLGGLVRAGRCARLRWDSPGAGIAALGAWLGAG